MKVLLIACLLFASALAQTGRINHDEGLYDTKLEYFSNCNGFTQFRLYWPEGADDGMKYPLLSYAHGNSNNHKFSKSDWVQDVARSGYVIVVPFGCVYTCWTE